jgi:hypothetical protein
VVKISGYKKAMAEIRWEKELSAAQKRARAVP